MSQLERSLRTFFRIHNEGYALPDHKGWSEQSLSMKGPSGSSGSDNRHTDQDNDSVNEETAARATRNWTY